MLIVVFVDSVADDCCDWCTKSWRFYGCCCCGWCVAAAVLVVLITAASVNSMTHSLWFKLYTLAILTTSWIMLSVSSHWFSPKFAVGQWSQINVKRTAKIATREN